MTDITHHEDIIDEPIGADAFFDKLADEDPEFESAMNAAEPLRVLADIIAELRGMRGLTQKELAERIGKHQPAVARIENASVNPGWETISQILQALRVTMNFAPAELPLVQLTEDELNARLEAAEKRGFAEGMARAASLAGNRQTFSTVKSHQAGS